MIREIVSNINLLRQSCQDVTKDDNIKTIIQDLKDTLATRKGYALAANQIGIQKKICYCKIPKSVNTKTKEVEYTEFVLINPKIIEKDRPIKFIDEGCLSFPGLRITTKRYVYCTITYLDEKLEPHTAMFQDLEAIIAQHECEHLLGRTLLDSKWRAK
jgi:peptide deformylase